MGGQVGGSITNSYSTGRVSGSGTHGGFMGVRSEGSVTNSFFDKETSEHASMCGIDTGLICDDSYGKTTSEMKQQSTFTDWDFDSNWSICEGESYPWLTWENRTCPEAPIVFSDCWNEGLSPHPICTCSDLNKVREQLDWNYALQNDVNCYETRAWNDGNGFLILGDYNGVFDGNRQLISSLTIYTLSSYVGLFSNLVRPGVIKNVGLLDVNVYYEGSSSGNAGGMVAVSEGIILNSFVTGKIKTDPGGFVGGIAGQVSGYQGALLENSYTDVNITGLNFGGGSGAVGGIVGYQTGHNVYNSRCLVNKTFSINDVVTSGAVNSAGGVIGNSLYASVKNSFSAVSGINQITGGQIGGFVGYIGGSQMVNNWDNNAISLMPNCNAWAPATTPSECTIVTDSERFYSHLNEPMASWGTWENVSGDEWATTDGNWSICEGAGYPWLTWENRTC